MNNFLKKGILIAFSIFLFLFNCLPVKVHAEVRPGSYMEYDYQSGNCPELFWVGTTDITRYKFAANYDCRVTILYYISGNQTIFQVYAVYNSRLAYFIAGIQSASFSGCPSGVNNSGNYTVNGVTYAVWANSSPFYSNSGLFSSAINPVEVSGSNDFTWQNAIYYTYGEGATGPTDSPEWGDLVGVGFRTSIAGTGAAAIENLDKISWSNYADSNGNVFTEDCKVQIQAVPGSYSASSVTGLLEKLYTDFVLDGNAGVQLAELSASDTDFYIVKWRTVISALNATWGGFMAPWKNGELWTKKGWIYQYRLIAEGYQGEWKTIYTLTSSGVKNDLIVINSEEITEELINVVIDINDIDVDIDIIIDIDDVIIPTPVPAPTASPDPSVTPDPVPTDPTDPWWKYLLNAILDLIRSVSKGIASIVSAILGLVSDLLGLFEFDAFAIPDINVHITNLFDNTGIIGDSLQFHDQLHTVLSQVEYAEPVLSFPGITLYNVQIIPELEVNLNDYVTAFGLSNFRNIAYTVTDGGIYLSLVVLIVRKVMKVLQK